MQPEFLFFGNSHVKALRVAADSMGIPCAGGIVLIGREMNDYFFRVDGNEFVLLSRKGKYRLTQYLEEGNFGNNLLDVEVPILSTVGFNTHDFVNNFRKEDLTIDPADGHGFVSAACFEAVIAGARRGALEFYQTLIKAGKTVYAVPSPQRFTPERVTVSRAFEAVMMRRLAEMGVKIIDVRAETTDADGILLPQFVTAKAGDWIHANADYGAVVVEKFRRTLKPAPRLVPSKPMIDRVATYVHTRLAALSA